MLAGLLITAVGLVGLVKRIEVLMQAGGIEGFGNSQNGSRSCIKGIPLTTSIAHLYRDTIKHMFKKWLNM